MAITPKEALEFLNDYDNKILEALEKTIDFILKTEYVGKVIDIDLTTLIEKHKPCMLDQVLYSALKKSLKKDIIINKIRGIYGKQNWDVLYKDLNTLSFKEKSNKGYYNDRD